MASKTLPSGTGRGMTQHVIAAENLFPGARWSYLAKIATVQGQPLARLTEEPVCARRWRTEKGAAAFLSKWRGAGVGISPAFRVIPITL